MRTTNLLFITLRSDFGGGPRHVDLLIKNLPKKYNIFLACPQDKPYYEEWKGLAKVQDIFLLPHRAFKIEKLYNLYKFCKKNQIHIVHSHGKGAGVYSRLLKLLMPDAHLVHTFHGIHTGEYTFIQKKIYFVIERFFSRLTNRFINVSEGEKDICLQNSLFKEPESHVIYNSIIPQSLSPLPRPTYLKDKFVVITISRFDFPKNMKQAYEIAKRFNHHPEIIFMWVGDGKDKVELEELCVSEGVNNIVFTGFSDNVNQFLSWSDLYLSTSRWEGLPYALIEAASLKIPLIASDVVGNNEVVCHGYNGYLFHPDYTDQAVDFIDLLYNDKILYQQLSNQVYQSFLDKFQIQSLLDKLDLVYDNKSGKSV